MLKPNCPPGELTYQQGYQQALEDFAIAPLFTHLETYSEPDFDPARMQLTPSELESLAAILIRDLTANLNGKAIALYLNALRHGSTDLLPSFSFRRFLFSSIDLPANFPQVKPPRFGDGDKLKWTSDRQDNLKSPDWGIAIGRFYSFAPHHCAWTWCYLIWLDQRSPSCRWTVADTAWEDDLEPFGFAQGQPLEEV
ncbi:MAG: hypothetical protein ACLFWI_20755 [Coleofasciculus sp.]|uniref:hypothetical protein n=1 Tax=Coleofasciculus sp. TaxID=3100458 RepID=UPI003A3A00A6